MIILMKIPAHLVICLMMSHICHTKWNLIFFYWSKKHWFCCSLPPPLVLLHQLLMTGLWWHWIFAVSQIKIYLLCIWFVEGHSVKISFLSVLRISNQHLVLHSVSMFLKHDCQATGWSTLWTCISCIRVTQDLNQGHHLHSLSLN